MHAPIIGFAFLAAVSMPVGPAKADPAADMAACTARHAELTKRAAAYTGDAHYKQLIEADLERAMKEQNEGDGDECLEALDHAAKLLDGKA